MCVSDISESGHYYAEDRTTPTMTTPVSIFVRGFHQIIQKKKNYYRRRLFHGTATLDASMQLPIHTWKRENGFSMIIKIALSWKLSVILQRSSPSD